MEYNKSNVDVIKEKTMSLEEANAKLAHNLKKCFATATKEIEGYKAFKYINKICLWDEQYSNTTAEQELYKRARRDVWALIRKYIPDEVLANIEIKDKENVFNELSK